MNPRRTPRKSDGFRNQVLTVISPVALEKAAIHPLLEPVYLTDVGYFPCARYHYRERESGCDQHILIYCVQGRGFVATGGRRRAVSKNSAVIIPRGLPHAYGSLAADDPWSIYWAHFTGSRSHRYIPGDSADAPLWRVPSDKLAEVTHLFHSIFQRLDRGATLANMIVASHAFTYALSLMLHGANHRDEPPGGQEGARRVEEAISYMQSRIHESLTLSELAGWTNLSKGHLTQLFKEQTGYSPIRFFINLKMQQACRYLDLTGMSVKEVAARMGYADPYYFSRLFRRVVGISPTAYRNIAKG